MELNELSIIDEEVEIILNLPESKFKKLLFKYILNPKNYNTFYKILFGNSIILLIIVLLSDIIGYGIPIKSTLPVGNWMFQMANGFLLMSYISSNILFLRIILSIGGVWFIIWMYNFEGGIIFDGILWNYVTLLINIRHSVILFYAKRPIVFDKDREQIYLQKFKGIMPRSDFKILSKNTFIRELRKDRYYAQRGDTCNNLSVIISGRIIIVRKDKEDSIMSKNSENIIYQTTEEQYIMPNEFIDSPEWIMRKTKNKFSVSMLVDKNCKILIWPYEILNVILKKNPHLEPSLTGVLGIDVSNKIFKIS